MSSITLAAIADVHANRWALEAVLADIDRRGVRDIVNLGDSLFGPMDPAGTGRLFRERAMLSIRGNMDRMILEPGPEAMALPTLRFVRASLTADDLAWLADHRPQAEVWQQHVLLCHGSPASDEEYLVERVTGRGVELRSPDELDAALGAVDAELVLCGHTHVPRHVRTARGHLVVNPGSVGMPAYTADAPHPHAMEAGSPDARYAILTRDEHGWRVEHVAVPYDWTAAARAAEANGRPDVAAWIATGRAPLGPEH